MKTKFIMISGWLPIAQSSYESLQIPYLKEIIYGVLKNIADRMNNGESKRNIFKIVRKEFDVDDIFLAKAIDLIGEFYEIHRYYRSWITLDKEYHPG